MNLFFSVGEPSGDLHGANLIRHLRSLSPDVECVGYGGPRMRAAGLELHYDLTQLAVMWFARVLLNLHHFWELRRRADEYFASHSVDAVVLIDYPGFNWWIARAARRHDIPVFYYGVPQLWAWAGWRIRKMRRLVDHVLCKLPFEETWYRERGVAAQYVGHPFFDETAEHQLDRDFVVAWQQSGALVTILPGSRTQEVMANLPWFLRAARRIAEAVPTTRFAIAAFNEKQARICEQMVEDIGMDIEVVTGKTPELMVSAQCCMACSGSVSLELLYYERPTVILYQLKRWAYFAQGFFRKVKYITLVNLLATKDLFPRPLRTYDPDAPQAEEIPFPEYLTCGDKSAAIANHIVQWLTDPTTNARHRSQLRQLKQAFAKPGASQRAAECILRTLGGNEWQRQAG